MHIVGGRQSEEVESLNQEGFNSAVFEKMSEGTTGQ